MDSFYNDERISSYLDGELSADEQVRFEERLAESAELRQLVEELRALRGSLDLLPRYQLEPDFAERVLRRAEQQMLIGGEGGSSGGALPASAAGEPNVRSPAGNDRDAKSVEPSHRVLDESRRWRRRIVRPLIYAGAAIAAAILIMVFTPPGGNEVAQNRPAEQQPQRGDVAAVQNDQRGMSGFRVDSNKAPAQPNPAGPQVASQPNDAAKDSKQLGYAREKESAPNNLSLSTEDKSRQQAGRNLAPLNESLAGAPAGGANNFSDRDSLTESRAISAKPDRTGSGHFGSANSGNGQLGNKPVTDQGSDKRLPDDGRGVAGRSIDGYATNGSLAGGAQTDAIRPYGDANHLATVTELLRRNLDGAATSNMIVANCEVAPETANRTFFALLEKHAISVRGETGGSPPVNSQLMDQISQAAGLRVEGLPERTETESADKLSGDTAARAEGRRSKSTQLGSAPAKKTATDFEVVYVEGSPQQIDGLVSALNADPAEFRSFELRSAPAAKLSIPSQVDSAPWGIDAKKALETRAPVASGNRPTGQALDDERSMTRKRETGGLGGGSSPAAGGDRPAAATGGGGAAAGRTAAGGTAAGGATNGNIYSFQAHAPAAPTAANPAPSDAKADRPPMAALGAAKEALGLQHKQADTQDTPSRSNELVRTADKSAPAAVNAPAATEGAAKTGVPPAPAPFGGAKAGPELRKSSEQFYAQKAKDMSEGYEKNESNDLTKHIAENAPPAPAVQFRTQSMTEQQLKWNETDSSQQADLGKGGQGQPPGFAFWLYPVPADAKSELSKEQADGSKFAKQKVEDRPSTSKAAAGFAPMPKSAPPAPSTSPAGAAAPAAPPLAEPARPAAVKGAPTLKAAIEPAERSAAKSANEGVPAGAGAGKPAAEKPADEKAGAVTENSVKLRAQTNDDQPLPAAMPQTPPSPHDGERSFRRGESLADANGDRAAESSPRMRAIFIFRIAPQPAVAAPPVEPGPEPAEKAK